jgi:glycosyltransferase involved in cell wall biosynthesis
MTTNPRCSVILPTHDRMRTLPRAVASVLAQDMADFELIVVDDASSDQTNDWLSRQTDPRIRALQSSRQLGPSGARNLGIDAARADVIAFLDSDDEYLPNRLSVPLRVFAAENEVVATMSSSEKQVRDQSGVILQPDVKLPSPAFQWALMCGLIGVESSSITVRTAAAKAAGGFCTALSQDEDGEFLVRVSGLGAGRLLPDVLWRKFWSADGLSQPTRAAGRGLLNYVAQRPEFVGRFHKLGSYRATKVLVADLRRRDIAGFFADLREFRTAGLLQPNPLRVMQTHREVRNYRRKMANREALASLQGPPPSWN